MSWWSRYRLTAIWTSPDGREGSGAFRRPGSIVRVLRTERWVRPTERAGSEGSFICRCLGQRKPYNRPGALWGLRVLKFDGAIAPRVLKFDSGFAAEGCGGRLTFIEGALL